MLTENICRNLNLTLDVQQTGSAKKAWSNVSRLIDSGTQVGLKLDCFHLDYFSTKIHFAGHYVTLYGYDDELVYLVDTEQQGGEVTTSRECLALARNEKGPMSSKNLSFSISCNGKQPDMRDAVTMAIHNNAAAYLSPAITNMSYKGILKTSHKLQNWFETSTDIKRDFQTTSMLMERAGTGGSLFRNFYRDFLLEAYELTALSELQAASRAFGEIAILWKRVAEHLFEAGRTSNVQHIKRASELLTDISGQEKGRDAKTAECNRSYARPHLTSANQSLC